MMTIPISKVKYNNSQVTFGSWNKIGNVFRIWYMDARQICPVYHMWSHVYHIPFCVSHVIHRSNKMLSGLMLKMASSCKNQSSATTWQGWLVFSVPLCVGWWMATCPANANKANKWELIMMIHWNTFSDNESFIQSRHYTCHWPYLCPLCLWG